HVDLFFELFEKDSKNFIFEEGDKNITSLHEEGISEKKSFIENVGEEILSFFDFFDNSNEQSIKVFNEVELSYSLYSYFVTLIIVSLLGVLFLIFKKYSSKKKPNFEKHFLYYPGK
ncbi:MAG: hypothetical protein KC516_04350, partial [Nanoarchaeota archaeon]|nr:hypothetical protein [Nanoarchaeota archaeon]